MRAFFVCLIVRALLMAPSSERRPGQARSHSFRVEHKFRERH